MVYLLALFGFVANAYFAWLYAGWSSERHSLGLLIFSAFFAAALTAVGEIVARRPADFVGVALLACLPWVAVPEVLRMALIAQCFILAGPLALLAPLLGIHL